MCGIVGWIDYKQDISPLREIVKGMTDRLVHRGPDSEGLWVSSHAILGHRRLIVVDPAGGSQPMLRRNSDNTYIMVYNGELYNTEDLRRKLKLRGYTFLGTSDTEVLLTAYIEWGQSCVDHLNGIFAFACWDEKKQTLFMARDRFGVKPLFFSVKNDSLIFASEIKSILAHPEVKPEVDKEGLAEIFVLGPSRTPGQSAFRAIKELKPAHSMLFSKGKSVIKRYWQLKSETHQDSLEDTVFKTGEILLDSIERQLVADVPVCTFLSGGLDSSAITSVAAKKFQSSQKEQLHTFSIDYVGNDIYFKPSIFQPNADDFWVRRVSENCGTQHHYIKFDTPELVDSLKEALYSRDVPGMADIDSSLWLFCREIKKHAVVALSGECADEVFGGYPWFHKEDALNNKAFPWIGSLNQRLKVVSPELIKIIKPEEYATRRYEETIKEVPVLEGETPIEARRREMFYLNMVWFMGTLLERKDRMSMAHGLEVRVPFCDHRLVEYAWNIPWDFKMLGGREKGLLREALKGVLPEDVLLRKKSPYPKTHNPSYEKALKEQLLDILENSNSPVLPLLNIDEVRELIKAESDYGKPWFGQLMATPQLFAYLILVDLWMREYKVRLV